MPEIVADEAGPYVSMLASDMASAPRSGARASTVGSEAQPLRAFSANQGGASLPVIKALRQLLPRSFRHAISRQLAHVDSRRLRRELAGIASGRGPIVAGPWLGEVGFELLYWAPFLAWFAGEFSVDPARLTVLSRGGTSSWYRPFAAGYRDVLDYVTPEAYKVQHDARVRDIGEQKQTRITTFESELIAMMAADAGLRGAAVLHPSLMYRVLRPFWWGHVDPSWVHQHARYRLLEPPPKSELPRLPADYVAVKFYFNDCFLPTDANRAFVRKVIAELATRHPVVSLSVGASLDDHGGFHVDIDGVMDLTGATPASRNLHVQSAVVAHAREFVGTYGGFAYLAPFYGVKSTGYFSDRHGFSQRHLTMAQSVFARIAPPGALDAREASCG